MENSVIKDKVLPENKMKTIENSVIHDKVLPENKMKIISAIVLTYVNLIYHMDRTLLAGVLYDMQKSFKINDGQAGLLYTSFVAVFVILAPLFGYLGDRYSRKYIMIIGLIVWSISTLLTTFMGNYKLFLLFRCFVGVGDASFSTLAPTIISDMFVKDRRSTILAIYYSSIPIGGGLGYMIGSGVTELAKRKADPSIVDESWRWGVRVSPFMGMLAFLLIIFFLVEPVRGESEGGEHLKTTSFKSDIIYFINNKSFILATFANICISFVLGGLAWWTPVVIKSGLEVQNPPTASKESVSSIFGGLTMAAGFLSVYFGSLLGQYFRKRWAMADPIVCGTGLVLAVPCMAVGFYFLEVDTLIAYPIIFLSMVFLLLNISIIDDIILYITIPTRRATAESIEILFTHTFGDAASPYIIGVVADSLRSYVQVPVRNDIPELLTNGTIDIVTTDINQIVDQNNAYITFKCRIYACTLFLVVAFMGAIFFFLTSCFLIKDREACEKITKGELKSDKKDEIIKMESGKINIGFDCQPAISTADESGDFVSVRL